ncbi:DUF4913 domain-containing protein [Quadrisphaera sp. KR29]|uniref:DUF4913 domain-containing protein n=1 Tax=Quadrisphaera sp. KR29 TaxID=3461391 RepID=UPI0040446F6D
MAGMRSERWYGEVDSRLARLELRADEAELVNLGVDNGTRARTIDEKDYPNLDTWVHDYFCATFFRPLGGEFRWCSQWRAHREAVVRLEALWRSWRALSRDPSLGISTWLQQFLDPQLLIILGPRGPFASCNEKRHLDPTQPT